MEEAGSREFAPLKVRVDELIELSRALAAENHALKRRVRSLATERAALAERNERAESLVESIIGRLRALEWEP